MPITVVVDLQKGDSGKGKIVDYLASEADVVFRWNGGGNAGHHVINELGEFKLHHIPVGILREKVSVMGNGMVIHPVNLLAEIRDLVRQGVRINPRNLFISDRAHFVMPWHTLEDAAVEKAAGSIGSTKRGIAYAYADKMRRRGFRLADFVGMGEVKSLAAIQNRAAEERKRIRFLYGEKLDYDDGFDYTTVECWSAVSHLLEFATRTEDLLRCLLAGGARLLGEGAQGYHLDIDFGCYPYVSSSSASAGGIYQGAGIPPSQVPRVIGVAKAYTTYVGSGPFITEMEEDIGRAICDKGKEFGTTTGRRRRVGWFDAVMVREAVRQNACSEMILVKLDVLGGMGKPKFCYFYESDKGAFGRVPAYSEDQKHCRPVYEETLGWDYPLDSAFSLEEIMDSAPEAMDYARTVANLSEVKLLAISIGPHRDQTFFF